MFQTQLFLVRALEILFCIGLAGCAFVVLLSWISLVAEGISNKDHAGNQSI